MAGAVADTRDLDTAGSDTAGSDTAGSDTAGSRAPGAGSAGPVTRGAGSRAAGRQVPRPQSLAVEGGGDRGVGRTDLGLIEVADGVVAKLSSRAALEIDDVGSAATRVLGKEVAGSGLGRLGLKQSELGALPACSAQVDGHLAFVTLTMSVRYPASVRQVAAAVREHVATRVGSMTGLDVVEVDITVPSLVRDAPSPPRVR